MLLQRNDLIKSDDFENEFKLLDESVELFKSTNDVLKKTARKLTWEVHDYQMGDDKGLSPEEKEIINDKKNSLRVIGNLSKG